MRRRAWVTLGAVVLGGGGVVTYAVASPSSHHGQAKRPVRVYDLALKSTASGRRELPRTETRQFSMLGVSWTGATKRLHGAAQVRTRSSATGEWTAWKDLEADVDPLQDPEAGADARGASEPLWVGPSDGVQVQVVHKDGSTGSGLPKGLEVDLTTTPGSLISRFELLVDGKVAATASGTSTSVGATLALGTHTVAVRAVHQSGRTTTTAALNVVAETTAPAFTTAPKLSLRTGTVNTSAVPVTLGWKATDNAALKSVSLLTPTTAAFGPTTTGSSRTAASGTASTWSMKAYDYAGNTRTSSASFTPVILQETSATRSGSWTARSSTGYLGGKSYSSGSKGASLTWTFTGRSASWVVSRASTSGQAYVYVDGVKVSTVDLKSSTTLYRQAIWTRTWSSSAKHTVKIVVVGTSGRPTITTDGLVYIK
ncbi:hypothetical protein [Streptomyces guryensis]|uniref:Ig-like domain (Group 3) n=1 Tax=Streptomyces guryensis TaxID=2886947 RepID=A0A9Q3Z8N8_9ACTN|nr:hypothetical protein [Streptomyces guryensis]MCD9873510.1 hypothetical protein [Streptomyces guryensis]